MRKNVRALECFFSPESIAVIGASHTPGKIGHVILQNFLESGFKGRLYAVNPKGGNILGIKVLKSVNALRERVELGVIAVPAKFVPKTVEQCGRKGFKGLVIISSGFSEIGNKGLAKKLEKAVKGFPRMRVIGPNCLGVLYMKKGVDTLFLPSYRLERPKAGSISFLSQSGALGSAILDWASMQEYGINKFVSYGNAVDVDEADLLGYLGEERSTEVIVVYVEGVKEGRKFFEAAKRVAAKKPVIFIKGGTTSGGAKATQSHTGSLAGSIEVYRAMVKQTGMIEAKNMEEVFDLARVFEREPKPKGNRVQIITNGGGYGVLAADSVINEGLKLAEMSPKTRAEIRRVCPPYAIVSNPMDLTGDADNLRYKKALEALMADPQVDMLLVILLFQVPTLDSDIIEVVRSESEKKEKPMLVLSVGGEYSQVHRRALERSGVNTFSTTTSIAKCLKELAKFYSKRSR